MNVSRLHSAPFHFTAKIDKTHFGKLHFPVDRLRFSSSSYGIDRKFKFCASTPSDVSTESANSSELRDDRFDWYAHWYLVMPICDLDKRQPHGKKILGIDVVVWWDRNEGDWKVFDDICPHRLALLSEGRIDRWGRLQCVYHGWCLNGADNCKFIPQAPPDGPPVIVLPSSRSGVCVFVRDSFYFRPQ